MHPHQQHGVISSDCVYTQSALAEILGIKDTRRLREALRALGCEPIKVVRVNLYPGRLVMLALERASVESTNEH